MKKITFPQDFDWGTASSGPQSEGNTNKVHESTWDFWYREHPEKFFNQVGSDVASDVYHRYKEDVAIMKEIGLRSFRTSIQWSRLIKDFETGEPDEDAVNFYNSYIDEMIAAGVDPVMNLFHFDMPMDLETKYGGFTNKKVVELYVKFATTAFKLFGDRVKRWVTFNEPISYVNGAYMAKFIYPASPNMMHAIQANYNIMLASAGAVKAHKELGLDGEVGIVLDLLTPLPRDEHNPSDVYAAKIYDLFTNRIFMDPCVRGSYSYEYDELLQKHDMMYERLDEEATLLKENTVAFVGVNYYRPARVKAPSRKVDFNNEFFMGMYVDMYEKPGIRMNEHRGWEIYPKAIYDIAMRVKNEYGNVKWFISENGMGVEGEEKFKNAEGMIEDDYRIEFLEEHFMWLAKAIEEGSNCQGYHMWTFVDNWSWLNAYKNRYGFVSLDLATRNRTIKKSGYWMKDLIANSGFEIEEGQYENAE